VRNDQGILGHGGRWIPPRELAEGGYRKSWVGRGVLGGWCALQGSALFECIGAEAAADRWNGGAMYSFDIDAEAYAKSIIDLSVSVRR
jgi:hypothetical protein